MRVWNTSTEAFYPKSRPTSSRPLRNISFSPNGEYVAASSGKDILVWDGRKGTYLTTFTGHSQVIKSLAFVESLSLLASFSSADGVFLWDLKQSLTHPKTLGNSQTIGSHDNLIIVANAVGDQLAVVFGENFYKNMPFQYSFKVRIWRVRESPEIGYEPPCDDKCFEGSRPHFIRFPQCEHLARVRYFQPGYESKITVLDLDSDTLEECDYNEAIHSASKPAYSVEARWIVSNRTGKHLLWFPESKEPIFRGYAVRGDIVAVYSKTGELSLLDVSSLETQR
jgi:WD40 repeat protein